MKYVDALLIAVTAIVLTVSLARDHRRQQERARARAFHGNHRETP